MPAGSFTSYSITQNLKTHRNSNTTERQITPVPLSHRMFAVNYQGRANKSGLGGFHVRHSMQISKAWAPAKKQRHKAIMRY